MSAGRFIFDFLKDPWYYKVLSRAKNLGATVEAEACLQNQIDTLANIDWVVSDSEPYGLLEDILLPGNRISPMVSAQGVSAPRITYQVLDTQGSATKFTTSMLDVAQVKVSCHAKRYEQAEQILKEFRLLFDRYQGTIAGITLQSADFISQVDAFNDKADLVGISQDYNLRLERDGGY